MSRAWRRRAGSVLATAAAASLVLAACQAPGAGDSRSQEEANAAGPAAAAQETGPAAATPPVPSAETAPSNRAAAAAAPVPPPAATAAWSPAGYTLSGTEPFWGGTVAGKKILYATPENQPGAAVEASVAYGPRREVYAGTLGGKPFILTLGKEPCSNGMSDHSYAYSASLRVSGEVRRGCADPRPAM